MLKNKQIEMRKKYIPLKTGMHMDQLSAGDIVFKGEVPVLVISNETLSQRLIGQELQFPYRKRIIIAWYELLSMAQDEAVIGTTNTLIKGWKVFGGNRGGVFGLDYFPLIDDFASIADLRRL